jgi:uncharacterized Zn finger protein
MGLIETASANSVWRGMDYYEAKKVISWERTGTFAYDGVVSGSDGNKYTVHIETNHPRRSTCNCPFAEGRRVVCKHMIALYFTAVPNAADDFLRQVEEWEAEEQEREKQHYEDLRKYVNQLSKAELRERLYDALVELEERDNYWR